MMVRAHSTKMQVVRHLFSAGYVCAHNVAAALGISVRNAREYLRVLHCANEIHIHHFGDYNVPFYIYGPGTDAVCAPQPSLQQREEAAMQREKAARAARKARELEERQAEEHYLEEARRLEEQGRRRAAAEAELGLLARISRMSITKAVLLGAQHAGA